MRSSWGTVVWAEPGGCPDSAGSGCSLHSSHCQEGFSCCHLHVWLCILLGWAVRWELRDAGKFILLAFWPRILVLESRKLWLESRG